MKQDRKILSCLRIISNTVRKTADIRLAEKCRDLSEMSACFILYLDKQEEDGEPVFQKNLEKEFKISKATVSQIVSRMEEKRLVKRVGDTKDTRLKWIILTDYARQMIPLLRAADRRFESRILKGFSKEEKKSFLEYLNRIQNNLNSLDV